MATAPEIFGYVAESQEEVAIEKPALSSALPSLGRMVRFGGLGAAAMIVGLAAVSYANDRLYEDAFVRLFGWF
ncbi:MAG: hypothetical protein ACQGVK_10320 [Myxococcota bacterium]